MTDLTAAQAAFLTLFFGQPFAATFYLTGGTALAAYHLGHRVDNRLDILANKVVALCDFPDPKHFVDLFVGATAGGVDLERVLAHAHAKRRLDPYHLTRALHQGKHARLDGLRLRVDVDREAMARWYEELRNRLLAGLGPPG